MTSHSVCITSGAALPLVVLAGVAFWVCSQPTAHAQTGGNERAGTVEKIKVPGAYRIHGRHVGTSRHRRSKLTASRGWNVGLS
jgi:hypothetical protein